MLIVSCLTSVCSDGIPTKRGKLCLVILMEVCQFSIQVRILLVQSLGLYFSYLEGVLFVYIHTLVSFLLQQKVPEMNQLKNKKPVLAQFWRFLSDGLNCFEPVVAEGITAGARGRVSSFAPQDCEGKQRKGQESHCHSCGHISNASRAQGTTAKAFTISRQCFGPLTQEPLEEILLINYRSTWSPGQQHFNFKIVDMKILFTIMLMPNVH